MRPLTMKNATFCLDVLLLCLCLSACFCEASSFQRKLYKDCTQEQRIIEAESWADAKMLAEATNLWVPTKDYQQATDMYMGPDSASQGGLFSPNYRGYIQSNEQRALNLFNNQADRNSYLYILCDESPRWFKYCQNDDWIAYEEDNLGFFWSNYYITFCPGFYNRPSLQDALQNATDGHMSSKDLSNFRATRGAYDKDGSYKVWGPLAVYIMARDKWRGTLSAYRIADAYHMKAMAILLQNIFGLPNPPLPHDLLPKGSEAVNTWSEIGFEDATFNTTVQLLGSDPVLGSNPNISDSAPNPTDWLDPAPPPASTVDLISFSSLPPTSTAQYPPPSSTIDSISSSSLPPSSTAQNPPPSSTIDSISSSSLSPTSTVQSAPSAPNRAILISYEQVFASLQETDTFSATAFTPGDSSLGDPCNADTLGTGKVSNGDTSLPTSMDVTFEGEHYIFTAQDSDVGGQLVESGSGSMTTECLMLLATKEQPCGVEGNILLTPRATCEWYE